MFLPRLRLLLPLLLGGIGLLGSATIIWVRLGPELAEVRRDQAADLAFQGSGLRNTLSDLLAWSENDQAERRVADAASHPGLTALAVIGYDGRVRFANHPEWLREEASRVMGYEPSKAALAISSHRDQLVPQGEARLMGYFPLELDPLPDTLRRREHGILFITYDLSPDLAARRHQVYLKAGWILGFQFLMVLLLGGLLDFLVSRRVDRLSEVMRDIEQGGVGSRTRMTGWGELPRLGRSLDALLDRLEVNQQGLAEQEELFRSAMTHAATGMVLLTFEGQYLKVNPAFCAMVGYTEAELLGQTLHSITHPDDRAADAENIRRMLARETVVGDIEKRYLRKDGRIVYASVSPSIVWDAEHRPRFMVSHIQDITDRILVNQHRWESERRLLALLEGVDQLAVMLDLEGRVTFCNDYLLQLTGWQRDEVLGRDWFLCFATDDWDQVRQLFLDSIRRGQIDLHFENPICTRTGERRLVQWTNTLLYDAEGTVAGTASLGQDVTELRKSEEALRASEEKFSRIFRSSPDAIVITDHDTGKVFDANPGFTRLLGYRPEEVVDHFTSPEDLDLWVEAAERSQLLRLLLERGEAFNIPAKIRRKDGLVAQVLISSTILNMAGKPCTLSVIRDMTERLRDEEERRLLEIQVQKAHKLESLGSLAGGMAHDMNNVLGAILGIASIHQEAAPPHSPLQRAMDIVIKACVRGRTLVQSLLSFARQGLAEEQVVDLNSLVREEVALLERTTFQKVLLEIDLAADLRPVLGDTSALSHVIMNLCVNAVDAMEGGGTLRLATRNEAHDSVLLEVADTGCGMSKEVLDRALDPFFTTKAQGKGTGLGLPIVYATIKAHGGALDIESTPGVGTTIRIHLPGSETGPQEAAAGAPPTPAPLPPLQVLIVDDDELLRTSIELMVGALHHRPVAVGSGEEALRKLEAGLAADLVILDMNMPGLGGEATLPLLRRLRPTLPVLLATGRVDQRALDLADQNEGVHLLPKPFTLEEVRQRIEDSRRS
jgi:PAS domain S-box-containing protein